jgi:rhamnopyranosyl-N-acetylglucosaminyl-diphospho-decaprenol beta-1,3/1,4-galactofuranosyltransferase
MNIRMVDINKSFYGVKVLENINFDLKEGEVHALIGENGAGKSTLVKILMGHYIKDSGKIYIIDNNSNDGTISCLCENGIMDNKKIELIKLHENTGGAGGFYYGLKKAFEDQYDWYWLMDDDCLPDPKCLENLLKSEKGGYLSPLVLSEEDKETSIWWQNIKANTGLHEVNSIPFNGALINNTIVEFCGLPRKDFFIFCDDVEYSFRIRTKNYCLFVNTDAILYHPANRSKYISMFFDKMKMPLYNSKIKHYCYLRNNVHLILKYGKPYGLQFKYREIIKEIYYSLFLNRKNLSTVLYAIIHGLTGNFTKTKNFM